MEEFPRVKSDPPAPDAASCSRGWSGERNEWRFAWDWIMDGYKTVSAC
jgi:hypothetical protein